MAAAVSTRPVTPVTRAPRSSVSTVRARFGSRFASVMWMRPAESRDADALTAGTDCPSNSYVPAVSEIGSSVASWWTV